MKQVTDEQNELLGAQITEKEVKLDVFSMYPEKLSGVDGLNPAFFQTYWGIVGGDVVSFVEIFSTKGR